MNRLLSLVCLLFGHRVTRSYAPVWSQRCRRCGWSWHCDCAKCVACIGRMREVKSARAKG